MANRYWRGGTAAWDGTAGSKWSSTVSPFTSAAIPTSADDVFFDATSTGTVTISLGNTGAKSITCTGFTGTLSGSAAISVSGSVLLVAGMTYNYTGTMSILDTGTITSGGKTLRDTIINGAGITVTLGSALTFGTTNSFTLTQGTIDLNGFTLSTGIFSSNNSNTRSIVFGSANIALTSIDNDATALAMATATNFTYTGTGGFTRVNGDDTRINFGATAGATSTNAPNFTVTSGGNDITIQSSSSFKTVTFTGSTSIVSGSVNIYGNLVLASGGTYTALNPTFAATTTFTSGGKTLGNAGVSGSGITVTLGSALTLGLTSTFFLTQGTIDLNGFTLSAGKFASNNSNTRSIVFGSANIALTSVSGSTEVLGMDNATGFTYTGTGGFTRIMSASAFVTFGTTGGGSVTNAPNLAVTSGISNLRISSGSWFKNLNFTGSSTDVEDTSVNIAGDLTLAASGIGSSNYFMDLRVTYLGTGTLTGALEIQSLTISGSGITVTCATRITINNALTLTDGTLKLKDGVTSTVGSIVTTGTTLKYLQSTTAGVQATISDTSGTSTVTYLSIKDSNATGGAIFDASSETNENLGNNIGWFGLQGVRGFGNFLQFFM
jgi:hypothetical protein